MTCPGCCTGDSAIRGNPHPHSQRHVDALQVPLQTKASGCFGLWLSLGTEHTCSRALLHAKADVNARNSHAVPLAVLRCSCCCTPRRMWTNRTQRVTAAHPFIPRREKGPLCCGAGAAGAGQDGRGQGQRGWRRHMYVCADTARDGALHNTLPSYMMPRFGNTRALLRVQFLIY
jgi:hypothetical protein